jgi:hypothetical protein
LRHIGPTYLHRLASFCTGHLGRVTFVANMPLFSGGQTMPDATQPPRAKLNPAALSIEEAALVLTRAGGQTVTEAMIRDDVAQGAPTNPRGTINLVQYAAWLVRELSGAD